MNAKQNEAFKISEDYLGKISGNPFEDCTHGGQQTQTCWERENLLQKLTKRGSLKEMIKGGNQTGTCVHIYPSGAVVFGERSGGMKIYSIRQFFSSKTFIDTTVQE